MKIDVLDCTLRDGGIVIDFNFGVRTMRKIKECIEESNVKYIECGYIDEKKGSSIGRTCFDNEKSIEEFLDGGKKDGVTYVAMIDYGKYDFDKLSHRTPTGIDGIRLAFHKENSKDMVECGKKIINKGYELYIQPMVITRYSDEDFIKLIDECNTQLPNAKGFYIVDSFGQMNEEMVLHYLSVLDERLLDNVTIGFHSHNNRQLSYANSRCFASYSAKHDILIDASIMGMGKGAGNLCTELILSYLNEQNGEYSLNGIFEIIGEYFSEVKVSNPWGYSLNYYLSSIYACTPSYVKYFLKNQDVGIDELTELLRELPDEKKSAFDENFSKQYLLEYFKNRN